MLVCVWELCCSGTPSRAERGRGAAETPSTDPHIPWGAECCRAVGGHLVGWRGHSRSPYLPRCCLPSPEGYCCLCGSENVTEANAAPAMEIAFSLQNKPSSHFSFSASLPQMQAALPAGSPSPCSPTLCPQTQPRIVPPQLRGPCSAAALAAGNLSRPPVPYGVDRTSLPHCILHSFA